MSLHILNHPVINHKLTMMRNKNTDNKHFREMLDEIAMLMTYEVTKDLPSKMISVETPVAATTGYELDVSGITIVPILRAGLGLERGVTQVIPNAKVGHIGLYRDPQTLKPVEYYWKLPEDKEAEIIVVDPMLATGGSATAAITMLKGKGYRKIRMMCLVAAPEGVAVLQKAHPEVEIYTAALDDHLTEHGYIVPGLGDAGDRIFGTK